MRLKWGIAALTKPNEAMAPKVEPSTKRKASTTPLKPTKKKQPVPKAKYQAHALDKYINAGISSSDSDE